YPSASSALMVRLLKLQGFQVIRAPYYQPRLFIEDAESETKGDLLIFSTTRFENIRADTYLSIINTIYYKYYGRWKSIIPDEKGSYKKHLDHQFLRIKSGVGKKQTIAVNGHQTILQTIPKSPALTPSGILSFSMPALVIIILLTATMLGLRWMFNL